MSELAERVVAAERRAIAEALNLVESTRPADAPARTALLGALRPRRRPGARVLGLTGPPGVGKSTLARALVQGYRGRGLSVGVLAIDPSSPRTGGALLGDRARIAAEEEDPGVFIRSLATRGTLGGLAPAAPEAILVLSAACERVLVETVGVGQSEAAVAELADTVVLLVQPGAGDTLQFLKAGLLELAQILVVTKADLGAPARRAHRELVGACQAMGRTVPVLLVSAPRGEGTEELLAALEAAR